MQTCSVPWLCKRKNTSLYSPELMHNLHCAPKYVSELQKCGRRLVYRRVAVNRSPTIDPQTLDCRYILLLFINIQNDTIRRDPLTLRSPSLQGAIYSSTNKSQMAPNEKVCFYDKLGLRSKHEAKIRCLIVKVQVLKKVWKKEDQCTSIFHFADRPEVPYEVGFWRTSFPKERFWENLSFFDFLDGDFGRVLRDFCKFVIILAWSRDGKWWEGPN